LDRLRRQRGLPRLHALSKVSTPSLGFQLHDSRRPHQPQSWETARFAGQSTAFRTAFQPHPTTGIASAVNTSSKLDGHHGSGAATFTWCFPRGRADQPWPEPDPVCGPPQASGLDFFRLCGNGTLDHQLPEWQQTSQPQLSRRHDCFWGPIGALTFTWVARSRSGTSGLASARSRQFPYVRSKTLPHPPASR